MKKWKSALFIYPYKRPKKFSYYNLFPPLGLEYIATAVKDLVEKITIIDMRYEREPVSNFFHNVDVIGISVNWPRQTEIALSLFDQIPKEATVIVGGIRATEIVQELLETNPRIDIIVRGDGEETARDIFSEKPLSEIDGISYHQSGKVVHNPPRKLPKKIEFYPDRSLRRYKYQHRTPFGFSFGIDTIMSSRGCPFRCEFCSHRLNALGETRGWSYNSAELVVEEIKSIRANAIIISDDNFAVNMKRVEKICDLLIAQNIKKLFLLEARVDIANYPDILKKMWKAGFRAIAYGIESAQDKTLQRIGKGFTVQQIKEAFKVLRNYKMISHGFFIVGYIGEDEKDMLEIPSFAHSLELDFLTHCKLHALKYSPLREVVENTPGYHIDEKGWVFSDEYPPSRLSKIARKIAKNFYTIAQYLRIIKKFFRSNLIFKPIIFNVFIVFLLTVLERKLKKRFLYLR
jgi:anaerobic magnesium-protoporphyrin IX monomethyl ester cyclase